MVSFLDVWNLNVYESSVIVRWCDHQCSHKLNEGGSKVEKFLLAREGMIKEGRETEEKRELQIVEWCIDVL